MKLVVRVLIFATVFAVAFSVGNFVMQRMASKPSTNSFLSLRRQEAEEDTVGAAAKAEAAAAQAESIEKIVDAAIAAEEAPAEAEEAPAEAEEVIKV